MILTPAAAPPPTFVDDVPRPHAIVPPKTSGAPFSEITNEPKPDIENSQEHRQSLTIPSVFLDTPSITHTMAAALALSLLGHVLFLKSQVPFPVVQLARMPTGQSDSRAAKKRGELLSAIDTLSSHMHTTFSALSTALARRNQKGSQDEDEQRRASAHLAFVLGPSVGAARARIILVVDGLEVKVWGERQGGPRVSVTARGANATDDHESTEAPDYSDDSEEEDVDDESDQDQDQVPDDSSEEGSDDSGTDTSESDDVSEPPPSPSPSPSPAHSMSRSPSPAADPPPQVPRVCQPPIRTYAEEQQALRAAERLLSRTLANACAEEGGGMSCELASTQTHILLRAPRRFSHPAWIPRQNMTRSLEGMLQSFLDEASPQEKPNKGKAKILKGLKTEGVYVGCRGSQGSSSFRISTSGDEEEEEEDEMIWWVWDGRITGFSDW